MNNQQEKVPLPVLLEHLKWNLQRLKEMLDQEPTPYFRDAALQRFEFTIGSVLKCIAAAAGREEDSDPSELLNHAMNEKWLPGEINCEDIMASIENMKPENRASTANDVYAKLKSFYDSFSHLNIRLNKLS